MPLTITRILIEGTDAPGRTVALRKKGTGEVIGSALCDGTGRFSMPAAFGFILEALASGQAGAAGTLSSVAAPGQMTATAGGDAEAAGTLTQAQPLSGAAGGKGGVAGDTKQPVLGGASGDAEASGTLTVQEAGTQAGGAGGQAGGTASLSQNVSLGGGAGGHAGGGPSVQAQALPISGAAGGVAGGQGAVGTAAPLAGAAGGAGGAAAASMTVDEPQASAFDFQYPLPPINLVAYTGGSGWNVAAIQDDPDAPDGSYFSPSSNDIQTEARVRFAAGGVVKTGTAAQQFRVAFHKLSTTQTGTPTARIELWYNGSLIRAGSAQSVTGGSASAPTVLTLDWDGAELPGGYNPTLIECKAVGIQTGGGVGVRNTSCIGAIEWIYHGTAGSEFRADFTGSVGTPLDAEWEAINVYSGTGSFSVALDGTGKAKFVRSSASAGADGVAWARTVDAHTAETGRYVRAQVTIDSNSAEKTLFLFGVNGNTIAVSPFEAIVGEDGEGYPITAASLRVRNPLTGAATEYYGPEYSGTSGIVEIRFTSATQMQCYHGANLLATVTLDLGATFDIGIGMRAPSGLNVAGMFFDYVDTGGM